MDLSKFISALKVESEYLPTLQLDDPFAKGPPNPILQRLKPKITVSLREGFGDPVVLTPYGAPGESKWPMVQALALIGVASLVLGVVYLLKR